MLPRRLYCTVFERQVTAGGFNRSTQRIDEIVQWELHFALRPFERIGRKSLAR